jgi:hypothetical protein
MTFKHIKFLLISFILIAGNILAENPGKKGKSFFSILTKESPAYLFSYFTGNGEDGLHLMYSFDGIIWKTLNNGQSFLKPMVGKSKLMRDPRIIQDAEGTFHMVWTTGLDENNIGYASSKDLINWSEQRFLPVMAFDTTTVNVWAPEIHYDKSQAQFIIIWASCIPYRFEKGIEAETGNYRMYYVTTKDFKEFSETKLFYDPGFSVIDAVIVPRAKDDVVLVLKDNTRPERNLKVAFGSSMTGPFGPASESFTEIFTEGPSVVKVAEGWLIYFDAYRKKTYDAVFTKDFVHFESANDQISIPEGHKHGTIFKADQKVLKALKKEMEKRRQSSLNNQ